VGSITVLSDTPTTVQVREVLRRNLDAVHFVSGPLPVGSTVRVDIDVAGRNDKMAQHTGQHLLSAIIDRDLQVDTLSWSLSPFPQPCYIELGRAPTPEEITKIQDECNELIRESRAVSVEVQLAGEEGGVATPGSVPSNYQAEDGRKGVVRTVEIEKLDRNPCCGTHFPSLSHLQSIFILPNTSTIRGTNTRLYFVVGPRVLHQLLSTHTTVRTASLEINCAASDLSDRVAALQLAQKDTLKREKRLREELAGFVGEALWTRASAASESCVGSSLREEDSTNSMEFLQAVAATLKSQLETSTSPERPHLFLLACGPTPAPGVVGGTVVITGTEEMVTRAGKAMAVSFGARIKGGGKGKWQGKLAGKWEKGDLALLEAVVAAGAQ
jgi:Ser-tRNA(Ala) deacylase AlaX